MQCPLCSSTFVRQVKHGWWQRAVSRYTGRRLYECWHCGWKGWTVPDTTQPGGPPPAGGTELRSPREASGARNRGHANGAGPHGPTVSGSAAR
jgi:hypothetical protein